MIRMQREGLANKQNQGLCCIVIDVKIARYSVLFLGFI